MAAVIARYTDEDIRWMVNDDDGIVDPGVVEWLRIMHTEVSRALQDRAEFPSIAQLDKVDYIEKTAVNFARNMADDGDDLRHGADVFATRAGEEELVAELRRQAVWCDERRAQADALSADARGLRDRYLRIAAGVTVDGAELALDYGGVDEALTEALRRRAAEVEELCADPDALVARMLASSSWRALKSQVTPQGSMI